MEIALKQNEIELAIQQYVARQGIVTEGKRVAVKFSMTRKPAALHADISLVDAQAEAIAPSPVQEVEAAPKETPVAAVVEDVAPAVFEPVDEAPVPAAAAPATTSTLFG